MGDKALNPALAVVWPVPPLAMGNVPVTPVVKGNPVDGFYLVLCHGDRTFALCPAFSGHAEPAHHREIHEPAAQYV